MLRTSSPDRNGRVLLAFRKVRVALISGALGKAFSVQIIETEAPDISRGVVPRWRLRRRLERRLPTGSFCVAAKAPLSILICGEAWDLSQASSTFDVVLSTAFSSDYVSPSPRRRPSASLFITNRRTSYFQKPKVQ